MTTIAAHAGKDATDWRAAVRQAAEALVAAGAASADYPEACVRMVTEHGPYIVLGPGLALVHARPEDGGNKVGVAAVTLTTPVAFGHPDNDPVDLLIAFCTPDSDAHIAALSTVAKALASGLAERLRAATNDDELTTTLREALPSV
ncbi:PTS system IIA component (L-Asc family) [Tamaricihabitans halophyticus]|uniref:Ascorbate-specific PTS system EIIA component n=1 Tax=Tamaricihabitans halophyticus TaxID=1262583 RepID=A0A4R2QMH7_9PSEU|nr:PTS sugar transporter subunit IIA [Tamaricihabitans halophyticus]TCP50089.1 PTS system IIA component (L-Asc family) [Tamaricihabitans halophyticus]